MPVTGGGRGVAVLLANWNSEDTILIFFVRRGASPAKLSESLDAMTNGSIGTFALLSATSRGVSLLVTTQ